MTGVSNEKTPQDFSCGANPKLMITPSGLDAPTNVEATGDQGRSKLRGIPLSLLSELNLDVHAGSQIELHQRVDRLGRRLHNVKHTLVSANLELFTRLLVDVRTTVHRELLDARRQRNGPADQRTRTARGIGNIAGGLIQNAMVKSLQANANILRIHVRLPMRKSQKQNRPS